MTSKFEGLPVCEQKWIHSFIFLQVPKTASSSIAKSCGERNLIEKHRGLFNETFGRNPLYRGVFDVRHCIPLHIMQLMGRMVNDYFSFGVYREPTSRIASSFSFGREKKLWRAYGLPESTTSDEYVSWLFKNRQRKDILILLPQTTWLDNPYFKVEILNFHNLEKDWQNMLSTYDIKGLPQNLPQENKSDSSGVQFSDESKKKILDLYDEDVKLGLRL